MLADGFAPCMRTWPIKTIHLQAKHLGYETDDVVVVISESAGGRTGRLFGQIKHDIAFTLGNKTYAEVLQAAWSDFKKNLNPTIDAIVLITGPLSSTDLELRVVLEWARMSSSAEDFFAKVQLANFSSKQKQTKLDALRSHLNSANGAPVPEEDVWRFLKCFYILQYDLDIASGVNRALLSTIIAQFGGERAEQVFSTLIEAVRDINQAAGSITKDTLPAEVVEAFERKPKAVIASYLLPSHVSPPRIKLCVGSAELAVAQFAGAWSDASQKDREYISALAGEGYEDFIRKLIVQLNTPGTILKYRNGIWGVERRKDCWVNFGSSIFDRHLHLLEEHSKKALSLDDSVVIASSDDALPIGQTAPDRYSEKLYKAFADTLALLATNAQALEHCSKELIATLPYRVVNYVLQSDSWIRWVTLNDVLPTVAEASPEAYLDGVEQAIASGTEFRKLYSSESDDIFGRNHLLGIIWGLEILAWSEEYLSRVTLILGNLDEMDPGASIWGNRPLNSLRDIFLPWHPQTAADLDMRLTALNALAYEHPGVAWKVLVAGLPGVTQSTSGTYHPRWRDFGVSSRDTPVEIQEFSSAVHSYAERLIELVASDGTYIQDLIENLDHFPADLFDQALNIIRKHANNTPSDGDAQAIWTELKRLAKKHRTFSTADWALSNEQLSLIETVIEDLQPKNLSELYIELFGNMDPLGFSINETWQAHQERLDAVQQEAIQAIYREAGYSGILSFTEKVEKPFSVGYVLGRINSLPVDTPQLIQAAISQLQPHRIFARGFVSSRYALEGREWLQKLDLNNQDQDAVANILLALPFEQQTWLLVERLLVGCTELYWSSVEPHLLEDEPDVHFAVKNFLHVKRPISAVNVLHSYWFRYHKLNPKDALNALLAVPAGGERSTLLDSYAAETLIQELQQCGDLSTSQLIELEWAYLDLLQRPGAVTYAKTLERRLSDDPQFYVTIVAQVYRSKDETPKDLNEREQVEVLRSYKLLSNWSTPPGLRANGSFDGDHFIEWISAVTLQAEKLGRLDVALIKVGNVLVHVPADPSGLWINNAVARVLNKAEMKPLRSGYKTGLYNARGVHWVDPSGSQERELGHKYRQWADEAEHAGYVRLSASLKALAADYFLQAETVGTRYGLGDDEME